MGRSRQGHAQCAPLGSMVLMALRITSVKTPILRSSPRRICRRCEATRARGWNRLRLLSAGSSTFKYDLGSEDKEGNQDSAISVFTRDSDGTIRHSYTGHPWLARDITERGIDELTPIWSVMDLTRQGRGTF